ncbi:MULTISPECIES: hypothetical protein [Cytobacillus]|nr:hypothetical protein [Cytobacillus oceanisediminis]MCM3243216.1 hypothetical protein [Cytobacillus oceanisediminis]MDK7665461.1 hypothetical protein [Cytobacillus oceanisediminis]
MKKNFITFGFIILLGLLVLAILDNLNMSDSAEKLLKENEVLKKTGNRK